MLLDLATLKERLGIPADDLSKDPVITILAEQAQALAENYCDRLFDIADDDETFSGVVTSFQVRRYPIISIASLSLGAELDLPPPGNQPIASRRVDHTKGLVYPSYWSSRGGSWPLLRCQYNGGLDPDDPAIRDLLWAITQIFDSLWASTPGAGLEPGHVGAGAFDAVKRFSVVGAYSVELGSSGDAAGGSGSGGGDNAWGILTPASTAVLDSYRRAARIGVG